MKQRESTSSNSDSTGLVAGHVVSASSNDAQDSWIVDSEASWSNDENLFVELCSLEKPQEVILGDGYAVEATGRGVVALEVTTTGDKIKKCKLHDVLYVPNLSYNLLSVSKATKSGKKVEFSEAGCEIMDENRMLIATATNIRSLYYLNCREDRRKVNVAAEKPSQETKGSIWHLRYCLGTRNLKKLAKHDMADRFDYDLSKEEVFQKFLELKALAENCSGHKLKVLRTDNGGEYRAAEFESYLKREGIRHA